MHSPGHRDHHIEYIDRIVEKPVIERIIETVEVRVEIPIIETRIETIEVIREVAVEKIVI